MSSSFEGFVLRQIQQMDDSKNFSLGDSSYTPLKIFLIKNAYDFHQYEIAKTYVLVDQNPKTTRVWAYLTLMNSEIDLSGIEPNNNRRPQETHATLRYTSFPSVKIARFAVDKNMQGQGIGKQLLLWCINYTKLNIMPNVGCRFLAVDAKKQSINFYKRCGFNLLKPESDQLGEHPLMFYDLYKSQKMVFSKPQHDIARNFLIHT